MIEITLHNPSSRSIQAHAQTTTNQQQIRPVSRRIGHVSRRICVFSSDLGQNDLGRRSIWIDLASGRRRKRTDRGVVCHLVESAGQSTGRVRVSDPHCSCGENEELKWFGGNEKNGTGLEVGGTVKMKKIAGRNHGGERLKMTGLGERLKKKIWGAFRNSMGCV
ncbi:hypothetical protein LWI28_025072 [Acer negundo]|uniref:Uncharacterized protein n=1 Tax=Acer negundo TaxID=4023 RepID=A0AAD5IN60_ACENE|nr:hypothetical protein LWI28_025072 [Acer negundo]